MFLGFLLVFSIVLIISITWTRTKGAPWVPTPMKKVHKMLTMAQVGSDDLVYDLGCGDGRTLITAARHFGARAVGIEIDPLRYLWCQLLITVLRLRERVQIINGDFFSQDLSQADVITCYLLRSTNTMLELKFRRELKPKARIISYQFTYPGLHLVAEDEQADLYLYKMDGDTLDREA